MDKSKNDTLESLKKQLDNLNLNNKKSITKITEEESKSIKKIQTYKSDEEFIREIHNQDIKARSKVLKAIEDDINSKSKIRDSVMQKIVWFLIIISVAILVLITFGSRLGISNNVEVALAGTVLGSVISVVILFCKYAFSDSSRLIDLFLNLSQENPKNDDD